MAQAPPAISYQAVARDANGQPYPNVTFTVVLSLHQGTPTGTVLHQTTASVTTNDLGLFTLAIGQDGFQVGPLDQIDWSAGPYFLEVLMLPPGGGGFQSIGTQQLLSVPYALHAGSVDMADDGDWGVNGNTVHSNGRQVGIGTTSTSADLDVEGSFQFKDGSQGTDRILTSDADGNASWQQHVVPREYAVYQDRKFNGADGGSQAANTWGKRTLNTTLAEVGTSIHRVGDTLLLAPGTYHIIASAPGYRCSEHAIKIYNTTDATDEIWGSSKFASAPYYVENTSRINDILTVTGGTKKYIIVQFTRNTQVDNLGHASSTNGGNPSIFTQVFIERF
ncbi:MAG: hypothetical protein H6595_02060 [Flavobacteriales bacterium]|nr:hypothetical protein [Flavobacteriales bacterium]